MQLPEHLQNRRFSDWNYLVRGLMQIWEAARLIGMERELEACVMADQDGAVTELLGKMGNECATLVALLSARQMAHGPIGRLHMTLESARPAERDLPVNRELAVIARSGE